MCIYSTHKYILCTSPTLASASQELPAHYLCYSQDYSLLYKHLRCHSLICWSSGRVGAAAFVLHFFSSSSLSSLSACLVFLKLHMIFLPDVAITTSITTTFFLCLPTTTVYGWLAITSFPLCIWKSYRIILNSLHSLQLGSFLVW